MQFLVICRPAAGGDPDDFQRLVPFETEVMREQKERGTLTGAWSSGHPGAVLMLEVADAEAAARVLAAFPLVEAGLISTEVIPLQPIDLLGPAAPFPGQAIRTPQPADDPVRTVM